MMRMPGALVANNCFCSVLGACGCVMHTLVPCHSVMVVKPLTVSGRGVFSFAVYLWAGVTKQRCCFAAMGGNGQVASNPRCFCDQCKCYLIYAMVV